MAPHIPSGERLTGLAFHFFILAFAATHSLPAQTALVCTTSATNQVVHAEGLAEPVGSLLLNCSGGTAGQTVTTNLTATFPTAVTNRVNSTGTPDTSLTVDTGAGPVAAGNPPILLAPNTLAVNGINFTVPATRALVLRLTNVRLAVALLSPGQQIAASLSATNLSVTSATAVVATPTAGLLSNSANAAITCAGSLLPATINIPNLFSAGTRFSSLRVTEGFGNAFIPKDAASDTGTRVLVAYSNFPAGARVFIPDYVAGNSAAQPTAGGDLGGTQSAGAYLPSPAGSLLLARVIGNTAFGAGGAPIGVATQFSGLTQLSSVTEVPLTNGAGIAVYEVIDASPATQESAQFPTFVGLNAAPNQQVVTANAAVSLGPISTIATATAGDPVPRFRLTAPPSDCSFLGDCSANYFPLLSVLSSGITLKAPDNGLQQTSFIPITNLGGGLLTYSTNILYQNGSGYIYLEPAQGTANTTIRVIVNAAGLTTGVYQASIVISAGSAGSRTVPVTLTVNAPTRSVTSVTNAATLAAGPLVAGSLGTIKGANLSGTNVSVTFDQLPATILYKSATQINFQVPAALGGKTTSQLVVTVDGVATTAQAVTLAGAAPGIFGVLNQDGTVNAAGAPVAPGSVIQIFATGLATSGFQVSATLDTSTGLTPLFAGDAPGLPGVQQVNVAVPSTITAAQPKLQVCDALLGVLTCSPSFPVTVR